MQRVLLLLFFSTLASAASPLPDPAATGRACGLSLANDSAEAAFQKCLSAYIAIPTINPPGDEARGADFLQAALKELGIPTRRFPMGTGRANLVGTLKGQGKGSVILLNHIDTVGVLPEQWARPELALGGEVAPFPDSKSDASFLWGRGSLDMKGIAVLQLVSLAALKKVPFQKSVHLVAVADEEVGSMGAEAIYALMQPGKPLADLADAEVVLNEGGFGIQNVLGPESLLHVISTEEKGAAWLKLRHPTLAGLMKALSKLQLVTPEELDIIGERGCQLVSLSVPEGRMNVSPSRVELTLECTKYTSASQFLRIFQEGPSASAEVNVGKDNVSISVGTSGSSHGSLALGRSALDVTSRFLQKLGIFKVVEEPAPPFFRYMQTDATKNLIDALGRQHRIKWVPHFETLSSWVGYFSFIEQWALRKLGTQLASEKLFRNSCSWTGLQVDEGMPTASLDCRLVPMKTPFDHAVKSLINDPELAVDVERTWEFSSSPTDTRAFKILTQELRREWPDSAVTAYLFPAGSDSHIFRKTIPSYGFFPVPLPNELMVTIHGSNERLPMAQLSKSLNTYTRVLTALANE